MKMLNGWLLVDPDPMKDVTEGGIVIPEKNKDAPTSGTILESSDEEFLKGDKVHYLTYVPTKIRLSLKGQKEKEYHLIHGKDVIFKD